MAIIRSIVVGRGSKGSIGDVTVRTIAGRVVASQKAAKKTGLSTLRQVNHQIRIANIMQAFRELQLTAPNGKGMYQAFPDRPATLSNANMFVRVNFAEPTVAAVVQTKEEAAADLLFPAPFIVSKGTLAPIAPMFTITQEVEISDTPAYIVFPTTTLISSTVTMGQVFTDLKTAMPELLEGDTVTFFVMSYKPDSASTPATKIYAIQFIVNSESTEEAANYFENNAGHLVLNLTEVLGVSGFQFDFAPVHGRNTATGYKVCDAQFTNNMLTAAAYTGHVGATKEQLAALSYGYKEDPFLQQSL
ncbi:MAG: hypothetical protein MJZ77_03130 [Bacteroidales bacterium]|nr:hypothetical protein [Bacteroidales bacterium]